MKYTRKTKDVYILQGNYGYGWDYLTSEDSLKEAKEQKKTYELNEKALFRIIKRSETIN